MKISKISRGKRWNHGIWWKSRWKAVVYFKSLIKLLFNKELYKKSTGGTFIHAHTLNEASRKYFTRAFTSSGVISFWNLPTESNVQKIHTCLGINATGNSLAEYMRTANSSVLKNCDKTLWFLCIESPNAANAFITKTPKEIYTSGKASVLDILFATASWVMGISIDK